MESVKASAQGQLETERNKITFLEQQVKNAQTEVASALKSIEDLKATAKATYINRQQIVDDAMGLWNRLTGKDKKRDEKEF